MREKIENQLLITCEGMDLTTVSDIEFYVRQSDFFASYGVNVLSPTEMLVVIPFKDAMKLATDKVELQFAFVDKNGVPRASNVVTKTIKEFLNEAGYDPIHRQK
jgi:hypothetical protein